MKKDPFWLLKGVISMAAIIMVAAFIANLFEVAAGIILLTIFFKVAGALQEELLFAEE